jgi:hypothetical protein
LARLAYSAKIVGPNYLLAEVFNQIDLKFRAMLFHTCKYEPRLYLIYSMVALNWRHRSSDSEVNNISKWYLITAARVVDLSLLRFL